MTNILPHPIVTVEEVTEAVNEIRNYMNAGENCRGPRWCDKTFSLEYTLQEWRHGYYHSEEWIEGHPNDFTEEYEFIHSAGTYNWHMYEDPEY